MKTLFNSTSQPKGIAMSALACQIDTFGTIRIAARFNISTNTRYYSLVMAEYPLSYEEARHAVFDAKYAESFGVTVINYGTDLDACKEAYDFWVCSK